MEHLRLRSEPHLHSPVLIYAFTGWNDAGDAASGALEHMITNWAATEVGDIDPEWFTDFATVRPSVRLDRDASGRGTPHGTSSGRSCGCGRPACRAPTPCSCSAPSRR